MPWKTWPIRVDHGVPDDEGPLVPLVWDLPRALRALQAGDEAGVSGMDERAMTDEAARLLGALRGWTVEAVGLGRTPGGGGLLTLTLRRAPRDAPAEGDTRPTSKTVTLGFTELGLWLEREG